MCAGGCQGAQSQFGLLLEVMGSIRLLTRGQMISGHQQFEPFASSQETSILKHVPAAGVQSPETALARLIWAAGDFNEAVVEGQVVSQGVLPSLSVFSIIRESIHDELVNFTERQHLLRAALDRHGSEGDVGVRWLLVAVRVSPWTRHPRYFSEKSNLKKSILP